MNMIGVTMSACQFTKNVPKGILLDIAESLSCILFKFSVSLTQKTSKEFLSNPSIDVALRVWNAMDQIKLIKIYMVSTLPFINTNSLIYIPKTVQSINLQDVVKWQQQINQNIDLKENLIKINNYNTIEDLQQPHLEKVQVRILCNKPVIKKQQDKQSTKGIVSSIFSNFKNYLQQQLYQEQEEIVIHIHGGGMVSMSSFSHQIYTRRWAKHIDLDNVPIFSIDYSLSPEKVFPTALDDCWQVYLFIINQIQNYYYINPKKIILTGDSAGGNIALGLCYLCQIYNVRQPDGLLLSYPALSLSEKYYTPSINNTFTDLIVPFAFIEICLRMYTKNTGIDASENCFVSPILATGKILQKLPPMHITCGELDCLRDDVIRFMDKLEKQGHKNHKLLIYTGLKHGYLNWDMPDAMPLARTCINDSAQMIRNLLNQK